MKKIATLILSITVTLLFIAQVFAQSSASVNWSCALPDSQNVSAVSGNLSGLPQIGSPGFVIRDYSNGPGPDQRWYPYENGDAVSWGNETNQVDTRWVQFAVYPKANFSFHADSITVYIGAKGTDGLRANVCYATDFSFSNSTKLNDSTLVLVKDSDAFYSFFINADISDGDTLYVRIYPWYTGSPSTSKYLFLRNATIWGTTKGLATPASATWELTNPATGGTGRAVATTGLVIADDELLNNTEISQYTGPENSQRVRIIGNAWPANQTTRIDTVFVQFALRPKTACKLTVTSVSLGIAAASINTMKAEIYYSTDSTFAIATLVEYVTPDTENNYLPRDFLSPVFAAPNVLVNNGEAFYLRIYPWVDNDPSVRTGKYVCLKNVVIGGEIEGNIVADLATVTTAEVTDISTNFATSGGNISTDSGAPVTARGVCWNMAGAPTVANNKTEDGEGSGSFVSHITDLTPGRTYYLRAYATNIAGTAYSEELTFVILDSLMVPTVTSVAASNIMVKTAKSGGVVVGWGGASVTVRGVCWNTTGNPTIADSKTENGSGLGSFTSILYPLTENTTYYVRAYATNSIGTGYGAVDLFTTQVPAPAVMKVVAKDGSGDYATVQDAFNDVPDFYTGSYTILVKNGIYYEKLLLDRNKTNVILRGEDRDSTILTYDDYAGKAGGTSMSYSVGIDADDFVAINITFQNTVKNDGSFSDQQGVALRVNGDRQSYYNCKLLGYQDTYYTWGGRGTGRIYMNNCYIEGSVDFIFGRDIVVFDSCEIHINRNSGTLTAASTEPDSKFGYVFMDCKISAESIGFNGNPITRFYLGRPWQAAPQTVFVKCEEPAILDPAGWLTWNVTPALYAEYMCSGAGANFSSRISISRQLTDAEALDYTLKNIFAKTSNPNFAYDWMPIKPIIIAAVENESGIEKIPMAYALTQSYPNPFNPTTTIEYSLPNTSKVKMILHNMLGEQIMILIDKEQLAGRYEVKLNASHLASGIYFYIIQANDFKRTKKMLLLK